jgi:predicted DNA-binding transcriptional regulator YafY
MTVDDRIAELVTLLKSNRRVTRRDLQIRWECVPITVHRTIARARKKGYRIEARQGCYHLLKESSVEVPNLVLGAGELAALLGLTHWLEILGSGVLKSQLAPIRARLESDLEKQGLELAGWKERIRLLPMHYRRVNPDLLHCAAQATLQRKKVEFEFKGTRDAKFRLRQVSPQTLVRYRDNWYLDARDHASSSLRCFALSRMRNLRILRDSAQEIPRRELDGHFAKSYGIFAGRPRRYATLIFSGEAARFVSEEQWHPDQRLTLLADGRWSLKFPCGDIRELARDVMRYADEVVVAGPEDLRLAVDKMVHRAAKNR